ncbi:putative polysaccharide biosynthesis protein [Niallia nealsonii]|uniref:Polysaccharide biosynthesis protein n=1 Tax=Niallia nealsonii TaxID=115979 RepID=A0A2N0YZ12_9BACI|nr:polysaccharide biosynthesis protein [Niallia nealsonii]PKG22506.1 polysaccharide biosynthesis protein [Niallia nealsonii]
MKPNIHTNNWFKGAFILTIGALITKVLSAVYRIPFQNIVGDTGFYIYQQVYPFYGIVAAVSTYGFPVILSKIYTEIKLEGNKGGIATLIKSAFFLLSCISIFSFFLLFFCSDLLAEWMGDKELALLLKVISFSFLFFPFSTMLKGIFQGEGDMLPIAVSQVGEQLIRVSTILIAATVFMSYHTSLYTVGAGAMFGSVTGGLISLLVLFYYYKKRNIALYKPRLVRDSYNKNLYKRIIFEGFTISISSMLLVLMQLADSLNLYGQLVLSGIESDAAKSLKGIYDRGQPLIQMGSILSISMALTLVPFIAGEKLKNNKNELIEKIKLSLKIGLFIGLGATIGLFGIVKETNIMLFENANGSSVLASLTFVIFLNAIISTCTAILQGLGYSLYPAIVILGSIFVKYGLNILLISKYGTLGAGISSNITLFVIMVLLVMKMMSIIKKPLFDKKSVCVIGYSAIVMFILLKLYLYITNFMEPLFHSIRILASFQAMSGVAIGGIVYLFIVMKADIFKEQDLQLLPLGSKLSFFLPTKRR